MHKLRVATTVLLMLAGWGCFAPQARAQTTIVIGNSTTTPTVDGSYASFPLEYGDAAIASFQSHGFPVTAYFKHTDTDLYICLRGLIPPAAAVQRGPNAVVYVDRVNAGGTIAHSDCLALSISYRGDVLATRGSGTAFNGPALPPSQYSVARQISIEPDEWSAEFRISRAALGGGSWNRDIRIAVAQQWVDRAGDDYGWPAGLLWTAPQTWAIGRLTADTTPGSVNLRAFALEVTQAIQDFNQTVPLVSGKRTFAQLRVDSTAVRGNVTARLIASRGGTRLEPALIPINPGGSIVAVPTPNFSRLNDSLLFELPTEWTVDGALFLRAELNPLRNPAESDYTDNAISRSVTFASTSTLRATLRNITYTKRNGPDFADVQAREFDLDMFESQLRRMYPVGQVNLIRRPLAFIGESAFTRDIYNAAGFLNGLLAANRVVDGSGRRKEIGMVTDLGGFMRGLTPWGGFGDAAWETSTPTGSMTFGWDFDGSFGDWYGLHELGHALGRPHVGRLFTEFGCGAYWDAFMEAYPYENGWIGTVGFGPNPRFLGFDAGDAGLNLPARVYPGNWHDVMSYCDHQWISDFNYTRIRTYINDHFGPTFRAASAGEASRMSGDFLYVYGLIDRGQQTATFPILSREPSVSELPPATPGDYTLELQDETGAVLSSLPCTPVVDLENPNTGIVVQVVPFMPGTRRIALRFSGSGKIIGTASASANPPTVSDLAHDGGFNIPSNARVSLRWGSSDADGDSLQFTLKYSHDGGIQWRTLVAGISSNNFTLDARELEGTRGALSGYFQVVANDGVNTARTESQKFSVGGKAPQVRVANPANPSVFSYGQCVAFEASAQDFEDGSLEGSAIRWTSSLNGFIGAGRIVTPCFLAPGRHLISAAATDSDGQVGLATVEVIIRDDLTDTTPHELVMDLNPTPVLLSGVAGLGISEAQRLSIRTSSEKSQAWSAGSEDSWIRLDATHGTTPAEITVRGDTTGMRPDDVRVGHITVSIPEAVNSPQTVLVRLRALSPPTQPPLTIRLVRGKQKEDEIIVSWPVGFDQFRLQGSVDPSNPVSWVDINAPIVVAGNENTVSIRPIFVPPMRFFRLFRE